MERYVRRRASVFRAAKVLMRLETRHPRVEGSLLLAHKKYHVRVSNISKDNMYPILFYERREGCLNHCSAELGDCAMLAIVSLVRAVVSLA